MDRRGLVFHPWGRITAELFDPRSVSGSNRWHLRVFLLSGVAHVAELRAEPAGMFWKSLRGATQIEGLRQ